MKNVALITTGGTIAGKKKEDGLISCTEMSGDELASNCELPSDVKIDVYNLLQIPSMYMSFNKMVQLKKKIEEIFHNELIDGVVVTHGTDSLEETAYFLDLTISDERPVIITGSQKSSDEIGTDAWRNLRDAIYTAVNSNSVGIGSVVVFNQQIWSARYVRKVHSSNVQGFESVGYGHFGIIDNNTVTIYQKPLFREYYNIRETLPTIDIIKGYTDADGKFIKAAIDNQISGIILEGVGKGQVPPLMVDSISLAVSKGIVVVITTSTPNGSVAVSYNDLGSAFDLQERGVILGNDYDCKKARIKLAVLLSSNKKQIAKRFEI